jgi:hypothetical protein
MYSKYHRSESTRGIRRDFVKSSGYLNAGGGIGSYPEAARLLELPAMKPQPQEMLLSRAEICWQTINRTDEIRNGFEGDRMILHPMAGRL